MRWPTTADVVVIGGGVMGASTLYHLTRAGCSSAVLLEKDALGAGSTGAAAGGIRAQFSDELNIRIGQECIRRFARFESEVGTPIDFRQDGYLFLIQERDLPAFQTAVALQRELGVPVEMLRPSEARDLVPALHVEDLAAATYSPEDASATPAAVVAGYAAAARRAGATIIEGRAVERIVVERGRVVGVDSGDERISTPKVVCAAGVATRALAATAGVDVPVVAEPRHVWFTDHLPALPTRLPLTIDFTTGFYLHLQSDVLLIGGRQRTLEDLAPHAAHRVPALADAQIRGGWHGDYEMSPDHNAVVGMTVDPAGLAYATGFSGHGFQQAPVVGEYLADLVLDRQPTFDLAAFTLDRFASGRSRTEHNVV